MRCPFLLRLGIQIKFSSRSLLLSFVFMPHSDFLNSAPSIQRALLQGGRKIVIQNVEFSYSLLVFLTWRVFLTSRNSLIQNFSSPSHFPQMNPSFALLPCKPSEVALRGIHMTFALSGESRESKNGQILLTNSAIDVDEGEGGV